MGQIDRLKEYFESGRKITALECWQELGISRLAARVWDLETKRKYPVARDDIKVKNRYGKECTVKQYWKGEKNVTN